VLVHFRAILASRLHRVFYIVCVAFVCSYIFFDVLDLDGSNFLRLLTPVARAVIVAETLVVIEIQDTRKHAAPLGSVALLFTDLFEKCSRLLWQTKATGLDSARSHGDRVGLPRDSVADASPYH
jgi:hypothetical protein